MLATIQVSVTVVPCTWRGMVAGRLMAESPAVLPRRQGMAWECMARETGPCVPKGEIGKLAE
jgi:hypothetical protein